MGLIDYVLFIPIQVTLLTVGSNKVAGLFLKDYKSLSYFDFQHPSYIPHLLFSFTLSSSCTLFLLVFSEIIHLFSNSARSYYWKLNLDFLLILVILVIPWFQLYTFLHVTKKWRIKTAGYATTFLWIIYLYFFNKISQYIEIGNNSWIEICIFKTSILGITIISILSGFGVVSTPFDVWSSKNNQISEDEYRIAEKSYRQVEKMTNEKRKLLNRLERQEQEDDKIKNIPSKSSFIHRIISSVKRLEKNETYKLREEVEQLEGLCNNMKSDLIELEGRRDKSKLLKTFKGKMKSIVDKGFSIYCIYKLIATIINLILNRTGSTDPITNLLSIMMGQLDKNNINFNIDTIFWSQQLSFWFAGIIVFGSVRGFLKISSRVIFKVRFSKPTILLFIAHMMGMYFLSSVLMMQMSLPPEYRYLISSSVSIDEFDYFKRWSDIIFVSSSIISFFIIYVIYITQDVKSMATDFADIQLLSIENGI